MRNFFDIIMNFFYKFAKILFLILILALTSFFVFRTVNHMFSKNYQVQATYSKDLEVKQEADEITSIEITIPSNAKNLDVSKILISGNIISDEKGFLDYLNKNKITSFKPGNYKLNKNMTNEQIANIIKK